MRSTEAAKYCRTRGPLRGKLRRRNKLIPSRDYSSIFDKMISAAQLSASYTFMPPSVGAMPLQGAPSGPVAALMASLPWGVS